MINSLFWIWGLPQNLIGLTLFIFWKITRKIKTRINYLETNVYFIDTKIFEGAVSLGMYVFIFSEMDKDFRSFTIKHEYGHFVQSKILGPLYMFVIAIPSMVWNACFKSYRRRKNISYYEFYTEKWANKYINNDKIY